MKRRDAITIFGVAVCVVLALLTVFAVELSDTQAKSRRDVTARVHERAVLAAALIDSLFQTVQQQVPQDTKLYGARTVSTRTMDQNAQQNVFAVLLDSSGRVLAHSRGFTPQARAGLEVSGALAIIRSGRPYGLGNQVPYRSTGVAEFAVRFPTRFGTRILITGFSPGVLATFIAGELRKIPGVKGAGNYLIDGNHRVLASSTNQVRLGYLLDAPDQVRALAQGSSDIQGRYYDQVHLANSGWRIILSAPDGTLFASVSGLRKWVPWAIFIALALAALVALVLGRRVLRSTELVRATNAELESVNDELGQANATLENRAAELARSNADLEQFASIASHDLQEPLRKVRTFTQQLTVMEAEHLSEKGQDYLRRTNAAAERMQKLIEDLLRFSRVSTHGRPFVPVDLREVTEQVLEDLDGQVEQTGATVHLGELPTINGDPLQMRQLMQNLISNSLKFHRADAAPEIFIDAADADGEVEVIVRDNGIGFDPKYARRIFRVFERLHGRNEYPGTGIGLALCRKIAERHGGSIVADGVPEHGATLTVTLPLHPVETVISPGSSWDETKSHISEEAHVAV